MRKNDESAATPSLKPPRHRADCADFFRGPNDDDRLDFRMPPDVIHEIEQAAVQTGRTWNQQLAYILMACFRKLTPTIDDPHTVKEWRALLARTHIRFEEEEDWTPFGEMFPVSETTNKGA